MGASTGTWGRVAPSSISAATAAGSVDGRESLPARTSGASPGATAAAGGRRSGGSGAAAGGGSAGGGRVEAVVLMSDVWESISCKPETIRPGLARTSQPVDTCDTTWIPRTL